MGGLRAPTRGQIGLIVGLSAGLFITGILYLRHEARPTLTFEPGTSSPPAGGGVMTLGLRDEARIDVASRLSPKLEAALLMIDARLQTNNYDKALAVARTLDEGHDRDAALMNVANNVVPGLSEGDIDLLYKADRTRAGALAKLQKLLQIANLAHGGLTRSRLLLRAAMVKQALDKSNPGPPTADDAGLDTQALLTKAEAIVVAMKSGNEVESKPFEWSWGILFTGALGALGYAASHLVEPVVGVLSTKAVELAARRAGATALADELKAETDKLAEKAKGG